MTAFIKSERIKFKHCDPAGIVFYPRYFEMANDLVEDWFEEIGFSFATIHNQDYRFGVPVLKIETTFKKPGYLGEVIDKELVVKQIGKTSIHLEIIFRENTASRDIKLLINKVLVKVNLTTMRSTAWNEVCKERMNSYLKEGETVL